MNDNAGDFNLKLPSPASLVARGLRPTATHVLRIAFDRKRISTQEMSGIIEASTVRNGISLAETLRWLTTFLAEHEVKIVRGREEVEYKKQFPPAMKVPKTEYSVRPTSQEFLAGAEVEEENELLTAEEEVCLAKRIILGDAEARNELITRNLRLVGWVAKQYLRRISGTSLEYVDLIQEGNLGLVTAVEKFDHTKGLRFTTYAYWCIRNAITRSIDETADTIRLPGHVHELRRKILTEAGELAKKLGRPPSDEEIATELGMSEQFVHRQLRLLRLPTVSFDDVVPNTSHRDSGGVTYEKFLADPHGMLHHVNIRATEELARIHAEIAVTIELLEKLSVSDRDQMIFRMYYDLDGSGERRTLRFVADYCDLTRVRIQQIVEHIWTLLGKVGCTLDNKALRRALEQKEELEKIIGEQPNSRQLLSNRKGGEVLARVRADAKSRKEENQSTVVVPDETE